MLSVHDTCALTLSEECYVLTCQLLVFALSITVGMTSTRLDSTWIHTGGGKKYKEYYYLQAQPMCFYLFVDMEMCLA